MVNDMNHKEDALPVGRRRAGDDPRFAVRRDRGLLLAPTGRRSRSRKAATSVPRARSRQDSRSPSATVTGVRDIVGVIRATGTRKDGAIVVGAHYDHLGMGGSDALDTEPGIHNGADDNASGTAALLEVAEAMSAGAPCKRTVIFAAWCGEEKGLIGSEYFCEHPLWNLTKIACSIESASSNSPR
jgi:acetylornithine deacetylase/succinyl-diaminopimelate desuccinylase-like protein